MMKTSHKTLSNTKLSGARFGGMARVLSLALSLTLSLTLGAAGLGATGALADDRVLFRLGGIDYQASELSPGLRLALYELDNDYHQKFQQVVDEALLEIYLEEEAEREGKSPEEIRTARLSVPEPDEDSVRDLYAMLKGKGRLGKPYEAVRGQLAGHLHRELIHARKSSLLAEYRKKAGFELALPAPVPPFVTIRTEGFPVRGNGQAAVTIVEFADYRCPHCKTASQAIKRVAKRFEGKVKVVYMDYLVTGSPVSRLVAQGSVCADAQGKFWEYHDLAYEHQRDLNEDSPVDLAREVGLDRKAFQRCLESEAARAKVAQAEQEARRLKLTATPTVFVNGERVPLHDVEQDIIEAVEAALK